MDANNSMTSTVATKVFFTPKKIIRILLLMCIVFVFCPMFLVSCSGQEIEVDVMTAVNGVSMYGETVEEPHPIMLLCLFIPIVMLVLSFVKKLEGRKVTWFLLICMVGDLVLWIIFKSSAKDLAEENRCTFEITGWFYANMIAMSLIIILTSLVLFSVIRMDTDLIKLFANSRKQEAISQMNDVINKMSGVVEKLSASTMANSRNDNLDRIGFCAECGEPISQGSKFCINCGIEVTTTMLEEAESIKEEEHIVFCQQCGARLDSDAVFCENCGTKVE